MDMGFRMLTVNVHSKLSYKNNHLIFKGEERTELIHLSEIDVVLIETTDVVITTMLIAKMIEEKILVIFCDASRLPLANLQSFYGRHDSSLQLQKQIEWEETKKVEVWTEIIRQKITNQQRLLTQTAFAEQAERLAQLVKQLEVADPTNREGTAARLYFNTLFGADFTRDLNNNINAGLDYGYTLLMSLFARQIVVNGGMTQLGLKHANQFNSFNFASDLMEPFRSIVDAHVYEHQTQEFPVIKRMLFKMFEATFSYDGQEMFLTNIVSDYVKKTMSILHGETVVMPVFVL
jgi:CRISPR-associated endonuclease Cas1 subtype II